MDVGKFEARPGVPLLQHLKKTSSLCEKWLAYASYKLKLPLSDIGKIMGLLHDIGKICPEFQKKLNGIKFDKYLSQHALLSSVIAYYAIKEHIKDIPWYLPLLVYIAIKRHHGYLRSIKEEFIFDMYDEALLNQQLQLIQKDIFDNFMKELNISISYEILVKKLKEFKEELRKIEDNWESTEKSFELYLLLNLIYSVMIDADRSEVIFGKGVDGYSGVISSEIVEKYKNKKYKKITNVMAEYRTKAYKEALYRFAKWQLCDKFMSLTLPTGMGKTLIVFKIALLMQEKIQNALQIPTRIIYALPFLSIIDQNFNILQEILENPTSDILIAHHHLVEANYKSPKDEHEVLASWFLIEGWCSKIIVTTFVQLFETLFSEKPSTLRKFHRIAPSIIILDEVQNFPPKYWRLFSEYAKYLSERLDIWWILVTATQPIIFHKTFEIVENPDRYFECVNRISVNILPEKYTFERLTDEVVKSWKRKKKIMVELNTIGAARKLYKMLKDRIKENKIEYLSSHIIPKERRKRIQSIKQRKDPFILITTQLIEAGVDLDFEETWRDIAPWDSMVQAAGRCNRNWSKDKGEVKIFQLYDTKGRKFASYIYDATLLDVTAKMIENIKQSSISESDFVSYTLPYFREIAKRVSQDASDTIMESIKKLDYSEIGNFSLIREEIYETTVFIEYDNEAKAIWRKFLQILQEKDVRIRKEMWLSIKNLFYAHLISVNENWVDLLERIGGVKYLPHSQLREYYDIKLGFKPKEEDIWIM